MKIEKLITEEIFTPIQLTITIESHEELCALKNMCVYNVSVPQAVITNTNQRVIISNFLDKLSSQL